jgi:hypothetical protein
MNFLSNFPKKKPPLNSFYKKIFKSEYLLNRRGGRLFIGKLILYLEGWMHKMAAQSPSDNILEIGAGTLNHLKFEKKLINYDVVEPQQKMIDYKILKKFKIKNVYSKISEIPKNKKYDKIFSIAVLEHLTDLPMEICLSIKHLKLKGTFSAGIPLEGKFLWGLSWRLTSGLSFYLRTGKSYEPFLRHEHINTHDEILNILNFFFKKVKIKSFPFPYYHLAFYSYIECTEPKMHLVDWYIRQKIA